MIYPRNTTDQLLDEAQKMMNDDKVHPFNFKDRISFMSMYNDIDCDRCARKVYANTNSANISVCAKSPEAAEVLLRTIITVSQLLICGAVAKWCNNKSLAETRQVLKSGHEQQCAATTGMSVHEARNSGSAKFSTEKPVAKTD